MTELARRCEEAEGPDRNLDAMIHFAIKNGIGCGMAQDAPAYTSSLDAAMTLVPDGWTLFHLDGPFNNGPCHATVANGDFAEGEAETPALALCAAALRAGGENG